MKQPPVFSLSPGAASLASVTSAAGTAALLEGVSRRLGLLEEATRFADAENVRWTVWRLQSYFRVLLGIAFLLVGAAAVVSRLVSSWLGVVLMVGGLLSLALGFSVGYQGIESGFQDAVGIAFQLVILVFIIGLLIVSRRAREPRTPAAST